jgi:hypothetical protein
MGHVPRGIHLYSTTSILTYHHHNILTYFQLGIINKKERGAHGTMKTVNASTNKESIKSKWAKNRIAPDK